MTSAAPAEHVAPMAATRAHAESNLGLIDARGCGEAGSEGSVSGSSGCRSGAKRELCSIISLAARGTAELFFLYSDLTHKLPSLIPY